MATATTTKPAADTRGPDPQKWITSEARLSYPNLFSPRAVQPGQPEKYGCVLIFPKTADLTAAKAAIHAAALAFFGADYRDKIKAGKLKLKMPFRRGDDPTTVDKAGYGPDTIWIRATALQRPGVVDQNVKPIMDSTIIYPGCYVFASLRAFGYENSGNRGVTFGLNNIQFVRKGESLGGASRPDDDFAPIAGAATAAAGDDIDDLLGDTSDSPATDDEFAM